MHNSLCISCIIQLVCWMCSEKGGGMDHQFLYGVTIGLVLVLFRLFFLGFTPFAFINI